MAGAAILIAAQSGRALAQPPAGPGSGRSSPTCSGDEDNPRSRRGPPAPVRAVRRGPARRRGGAGEPRRARRARRARRRWSLSIVLGSGFEGAPDLIRRIGERYHLLGASPETVAVLKDPDRFAALCARLGIPHPAVTAEPRPDPSAWLLKRIGGSGGGHIRGASRGRAPPGAYFQARVPGRAYALNVLADGRDLRVLAVTEQWSAPSPVRPFRYAGALARGAGEAAILPEALVAEVTDAVGRIVEETGLRRAR